MSRAPKRTRFVGIKMSDHDHKRLVDRAARAGAKSVSAYIRAACLIGREPVLPPWEHLRELRNAVINANNARDLPALVDALERISRF